LAKCRLRGESIVCFAGEDWWYHHPHSKNHILKRFAQDNRVLFINSITMGLPSISNPDFFLKVRRKLKSYARWLKRAPEGLYVMSPVTLPFYGFKLARAINVMMLVFQVRLAMLLCGMRRPVLWVAIPSAADVVRHLGARLLLYQVSDKYDANEDSALSREVIRRWDTELKERADVVMYSGRKLFQESDAERRYFLEQAVDFEHFAVPAAETAPDVADIPRPVLGYIGAMDYVMDLPLIQEVVRRRPEWQWMLIGLKSNLVQLDAPNVHFLGSRPYSDLPRYLRHIDVCILPWRHGHVFTSYGSAIKVREYLATGKPIVMAPLYEYRDFSGIRFYRDVDGFISAVEDALQHDTPEQRKSRQAQVQNCTWDVRAEELGELITALLEGNSLQEAVGKQAMNTVAAPQCVEK
jgi:glycosyltransferase involved in cell wall biosynthesis